MNKLTDDRFKELKTLHIASKPELSKFKDNVAAVIRKKDFHRLAVVYESVMCVFDSYDEVIDELLAGVEEAREEVGRMKEENEQLKRFKMYFDELYGQGLEVSNWHQNGDTEPFDNFHESAESEMTAIQRSQEGKVHEQ